MRLAEAVKAVPLELQKDAGWRAALSILCEAFPDRKEVWRHVELGPPRPGWSGTGIRFQEMLDAIPWSSSERLLLECAASLFDREVKVNLWEVLNRVDYPQLEILNHAIQRWLGKPL